MWFYATSTFLWSCNGQRLNHNLDVAQLRRQDVATQKREKITGSQEVPVLKRIKEPWGSIQKEVDSKGLKPELGGGGGSIKAGKIKMSKDRLLKTVSLNEQTRFLTKKSQLDAWICSYSYWTMAGNILWVLLNANTASAVWKSQRALLKLALAAGLPGKM